MVEARISNRGTILARIVDGVARGYSDRVIADHLGIDVKRVSAQVAILGRAGRLAVARPSRRGVGAGAWREETISREAIERLEHAAARRAITPSELTRRMIEAGSEIVDAILDDQR